MRRLLEVRRPQPHDLDGWASCLEAAFAIRLGEAERERLGSLGERSLAAFDDGELVGTLGAFEAEMTLPGAVSGAVLALEDVAVLPTHHRRGVMSALVAAALGRCGRDGPALVVLQASEGGIYGRFGFGPACSAARYRLRHGEAALAPEALSVSGAEGGRVRLLGADEALEAFPAIFDEARRRRAGELARRAGSWPDLVGESLPARGSRSGAPAGRGARSRRDATGVPRPATPGVTRWLAGFECSGRLDGYAVYDLVEPAVAPRRLVVHLVELVTTCPAATAGLWSYLLGLDLTSELLTAARPLDEPLRHLLADPRSLETVSVVDWTWLRIAAVAPALASRRYGAEGRLAIELSDAPCPWNEGRFVLEVNAAGSASVEGPGPAGAAGPAGHPAVLTDAASLACAFLGGASFSELALAGRARPSSPEALARADAMFACRPLPFCTLDF